MNELEKSIHDNVNGLDYPLVNDHYLPNLTAAAPAEQHPTGRWGRLHKMYLKEQHPIQYNQLLLQLILFRIFFGFKRIMLTEDMVTEMTIMQNPMR